jgi:hypothetical protein
MINITTATTVASNTWHYLAVVVNTNGNPTPNTNGVYPVGSVTATMYLDGQLTATSVAGDFAMNDAGAFTIGARYDNAFYFAGEEDEVAYYTNAVSSNTIAAHYAAGTNTSPPTPYYQLVQESNPMLFYQLDEGLPPENLDPLALNYGATGAMDNGYYLPGTFPATVPGPNVAGFPATGTNNRAVSFNHNYWSGSGNPGVTGFIDVPYNTGDLNILGPITVSAWIQAAPTQGRSAWECFVGRGDSSYRLQVLDQSPVTNSLMQFGDGGQYVNAVPPGTNPNDGKWHFVVGTWDGSTASFYLDGILNAGNFNPGTPAGSTINDLTIGESPDNEPNRIFDGNIAQVAIFDYALSAAQIQSLYDAAGEPPVFTQQPPASMEVSGGGTAMISVEVTGTPVLGYQWFKGAGPVSGAEFSGANTATLTSSGATALDAGTYSVVVSNSYGTNTSSSAALSVVAGPAVVGFNGDGLDWVLTEGSVAMPTISSNVLTLTVGQYGEASSAFFDPPQYIGGFIASYIYKATGTAGSMADGATFCIQNNPDGLDAVGVGGGGLGYDGLTNSAAFEMNLWPGSIGGIGIQFGTDGLTPDTTPRTAPYFTTAPVNITSGDPIYVQLYYIQNVLTVWMVDTTTRQTFSTSFSVPNLPAIVGAGSEETAYVGFTGGTGGATSTQTVSNFVFSSTTPPILSVASGAAGSVVVSWPLSIATLFELQQSATLAGPWSNVTSQVVNGQNQATLTPGTSTVFFRLSLQ